jgi:hypothetical protein
LVATKIQLVQENATQAVPLAQQRKRFQKPRLKIIKGNKLNDAAPAKSPMVLRRQ